MFNDFREAIRMGDYMGAVPIKTILVGGALTGIWAVGGLTSRQIAQQAYKNGAGCPVNFDAARSIHKIWEPAKTPEQQKLYEETKVEWEIRRQHALEEIQQLRSGQPAPPAETLRLP